MGGPRATHVIPAFRPVQFTKTWVTHVFRWDLMPDGACETVLPISTFTTEWLCYTLYLSTHSYGGKKAVIKFRDIMVITLIHFYIIHEIWVIVFAQELSALSSFQQICHTLRAQLPWYGARRGIHGLSAESAVFIFKFFSLKCQSRVL